MLQQWHRGAVTVDLLGRAAPVVRTPQGLRAVITSKPCDPVRIERYLAGKFGAQIEDARAAMTALAAAFEPADLHRRGVRLYERFRPSVPAGESSWRAKCDLDLGKVRPS
jgi:hypothetical protein